MWLLCTPVPRNGGDIYAMHSFYLFCAQVDWSCWMYRTVAAEGDCQCKFETVKIQGRPVRDSASTRRGSSLTQSKYEAVQYDTVQVQGNPNTGRGLSRRQCKATACVTFERSDKHVGLSGSNLAGPVQSCVSSDTECVGIAFLFYCKCY